VFFSISDSENFVTHKSNNTYPTNQVTELSQPMTELSFNHLLYKHKRCKKFTLSDTDLQCFSTSDREDFGTHMSNTTYLVN
jgi:hypothetical protein